MSILSRREALIGLTGLLSVTALPHPVLAAERHKTRQAIALPDFSRYTHPSFGRKQHEELHPRIEREYGFSQEPGLTRWNSNPSRVYVNEPAGESIHITGIHLEEDYTEMIWVLAPAYTNQEGKQVFAHVPFEHQHTNQAESFERIQGRVTARVNGALLKENDSDFFVAEPEDDHIAWNPGEEPLVMRVRYTPGFAQDGERALMVYWGFVDEADRVKAEGQPKNFALLGALNAHLRPQALASGMPKMLPQLAHPFLINPMNRNKVADLYKELTHEKHPHA